MSETLPTGGVAPAPTKRRALDLDLLRIFACFLVIFNHTNERGFYRYLTDDPGTFLFWFNLFCSIACKVAVPLYFMISGALLLRKEESIGKTYKRSIRIFADILVFSLLFYGIEAMETGVPLTLKWFVKNTVQDNVDHLWFLYSYIALLVTVPILRGMVRAMTNKEALVLFVLSVLIADILPVFEFYVASIKRLIVPSWPVSIILIFPILGYFLSNRVDLSKVTWKHMAILWAINLLLFAIAEVTQYYFLQERPGTTDETFMTNNRIMNAAVVYLTFRKAFDGLTLSERWTKVLVEVGTCTFGIYLMHPLFIWHVPQLTKFWTVLENGGFLRNEFGIVLTVLCTFLISLAVTWVLRRIPLVKKLF